MAFPPFTQISPTTGVSIDRITFPSKAVNNYGPFLRYNAGGTRVATYVVLVNGPGAVAFDSWNPVTGTPATTWDVHVMVSFDAGATWAEADAASGNKPEVPPANSFAGQLILTNGFSGLEARHDTVNGIIYIAHLGWPDYKTATARHIVISRFSTATDSWLTPLTLYGDANAPVVDLTQGPWGSGTQFTYVYRHLDGHHFVAYTNTEFVGGSPRVGNLYDHAWISEHNGTVWSAPVRLAGDNTVALDFPCYGSVVGESNRLHFFMFTEDPADGLVVKDYDIYSRSLSSAGALDTLAIVVTSSPAQDTSGREYPVCRPTTQPDGANTNIVLGMKRDTNGAPPSPFTSFVAQSQVDMVVADFTAEVISTVVLDWESFLSFSVGGIGVDENDVLQAFSWGDNEFFNQWTLGGLGWTGPTLLDTDGTFLNGDISVGDVDGLVSIFSNLGPVGLFRGDEIWYWEIGAAVAPVPPVPASTTLAGPGGSGIGSNICQPRNHYDRCVDGQNYLAKLIMDELTWGDEAYSISPPWVTFPFDGQRFQKHGSIVLPVDNSMDNLVLRFRVPLGWSGVIMTITNSFEGTGFIAGSGDIHWRVRVNFGYLKDQGDIVINRGDLRHPYSLEGGGYRVFSNDTVRMFVNITAGAAARLQPGARIVCALTGWFYPQEREHENTQNTPVAILGG